MRGGIAFAVFIVFLSTPAWSSECLKALATIDQIILSSTTISEEKMSQVRSLRQSGEKMHNNGQHGRAQRRLKLAIRMLRSD